jgi:hypothetical protein
MSDWVNGRDDRVCKCGESARIRILNAEAKPPIDWFEWYVVEMKRQEGCWKKAMYRR